MDITFRTTKLRKAYENQANAEREWGAKIGRRYVQRINELYAASNAHDLGKMPALRLHPLKGSMKGKFAVNIDGAWRLIVSFADDPRTQVTIEEVSDHYDD